MEAEESNIQELLFDDLLIAIVFFNGDKTVSQNVAVISKTNAEILIISNRSEEKSQVILEDIKKYEHVHIIANEENLGIGYALNQALDYATKRKKKYLLTMDQDSLINVDCISKLERAIKTNDKKVVSVGPYYATNSNINKTVKYLITSGNMISVRIANKIGGFDSSLFIDCVDLDFSFKLLAYGYKMVMVGGAFMNHKIGDVQTDSPIGISYYGHRADRCFYNFRNNVYIYRKYARILPGSCFKLFLSLCLKSLKILFIEGDKKNKLIQACRGIKSGFNMGVSPIRGNHK